MSNSVTKPNDIIATKSLYESKEKVYPREIKGVFQRYRTLCVISILCSYYGLAWLQWNGHQAILFDLPARKFYIFDLIFWPQDFFLLSWILIICALSLFFFTALVGRVWCGYACPQTVWTELFVWIERWVEGGRQAQIRLKKSKLTKDKWIKKITKHGLWIILALCTGFTFVGYFTPIRELGVKFFDWSVGPWETFWVFFYSFAAWGNAGFLREQVCIYMCPYARFQSVMFDKDTLLISYDTQRGEPRGKLKDKLRGKLKNESVLEMGDCINCTLCVQVCPTGIDIRNGLQYECISCGACIDACDQVMEGIGRPKGLIRYATENSLECNKTKIFRPRIFVYAVILGVFLTGFVSVILLKKPLAVDILRDRNALYRMVDSHLIENVYTFKIMNKSNVDTRYAVFVDGIKGGQAVLSNGENVTALILSGETANVPVRIQAPIDELNHSVQTIFVTIKTQSNKNSIDEEEISIEELARFFSPDL